MCVTLAVVFPLTPQEDNAGVLALTIIGIGILLLVLSMLPSGGKRK
jgi:hypothetical protein